MSWIGRSSLQSNDSSHVRRRSASVEASRWSASSESRARGSSGIPRPRSSSEERKSHIYTRFSGSCRNSLINEAKVIVKDPRPLNDKTYQRTKLAELVEYLQTTTCPHPVTVQKLMTPSKKEFENIFQYLMSFWNDKYEVKRIEEEAPKMLKDLCYPFVPSKQSFLYVARTNWPSLLGVLLFLMDVSKFGMKLDPNLLFGGDSDRSGDNSLLFEYIFNCYFAKNDDEAKMKQVFVKIITSKLPANVEELESTNRQLRGKIDNVQSEIGKLNSLKKLCEQQDQDLRKYEEYFNKMKEHRQKKDDKCQQLVQELSEKEAELQNLESVLKEKQAVYDIQGFDGKKQLVYYENQKKELSESLQCKKASLENLQTECWEAEMQYSQTYDKGASTCDTFNKLYAKVAQLFDTFLDLLKDTNDPQLDSLRMNLNIDFPDCKMHQNKKVFAQGNFLEEIKRKIDSLNVICKSMTTKQSQLLHEHVMKKSELSISLKVAMAQETQKQRDLSSKEKQLMEEWKTLEVEYEDTLKLLEKAKAEQSQLESVTKEHMEELILIQNLKKAKQKMLDDYLKLQKEMISRHAKILEENRILMQKSGEEIYEFLQKSIKK